MGLEWFGCGVPDPAAAVIIVFILRQSHPKFESDAGSPYPSTRVNERHAER